MRELRRVTLRTLPARIEAARLAAQDADRFTIETEPEVRLPLQRLASGQPARIHLLVLADDDTAPPGGSEAWARSLLPDGDSLYVLWPRGVGPTRWTQRNPPNYVERSHALLGMTADLGRVRDIAATVRFLRGQSDEPFPITVLASGAAGILAVYAALVEPDIDELIVRQPQDSHMEPSAPQLLNVLRVLDIPHAMGLLAPRRLTVVAGSAGLQETVRAIYAAAGASERFQAR
jgi:hypothetical protein